MVTYKTKDGTLTGFLPGVGPIVDGKITVPDGVVIENANLEKVEEQLAPQPAPAAPVTSATPPAASQPAPVSTPQPTAPANEQQPISKESN